nr:hypothetical protein GCM10017547_19820 [Pseudarthrobacter oxydans]BFE45361.1 hypothetical protein GCM10017547_32540 [Pseudarthrobacter oxydans]
MPVKVDAEQCAGVWDQLLPAGHGTGFQRRGRLNGLLLCPGFLPVPDIETVDDACPAKTERENTDHDRKTKSPPKFRPALPP